MGLIWCLLLAGPAAAATDVADSLLLRVQERDWPGALLLGDELWASAADKDCSTFEAFEGLAIAFGQGGRARETQSDQAAERALALALECHGSGSAEHGRALKVGADLHAFRGENIRAIAGYEQAVEVLESAQAEAPLAQALSNLGACRRRIGEFDAALEALESALALQQSLYGRTDPRLAGSLSNLGSVLREAGDYTAAREAHSRALDLLDRRSTGPDETLARTLANLALLEADLEEYSAARANTERAIKILENVSGEGAEATLDAKLNLASILNDMGASEEALELIEEVIPGYEVLWGDQDPWLQVSLDVQAQVLVDLGRFDEAIEVAERSSQLVRQSEGEDSFYLIYSFAVLTQAHRGRGDLLEASQVLDHSLRIVSAELGQDSARLIPLYLDRAELALLANQSAEARVILSEAHALLDGEWAEGHPWKARAALLDARLKAEAGDLAAATKSALSAEAVSREFTLRGIASLEERRALSLADSRVRGLDAALAWLPQSAELTYAVWDAAMQSRGLVLEEMIRRQRRLAADPEVVRLRETLQARRARFVTLQLREADEVPVAQIQAARLSMDEAERQLAERAPRDGLRIRQGLSEVFELLGSETSLIAWYTFTDLDDVPQLGAFSWTESAGVRWTPLGEVSQVEAAMVRWKEQAAWGEGARRGILQVSNDADRRLADYQQAAVALRRLVLDPLPQDVLASKTVCYVPDGPLQLLSLQALVDDDGKFLAEHNRSWRRVSTEREFLRAREGKSTGMLAVGSPDLQPKGSEELRLGECARDLLAGLGDLDGARAEAREIASLQQDAMAVQLLLDRQATETAVRETIQGKRWVHLATHGFALEADCLEVDRLAPTLHPLLYNGVMLGSSDSDDGWWTGQEIAALDLSGTDCVVLSACESAAGELSGDGLHGLRRAFELTGAHSTVLALWAIDDTSTRDWMVSLYRTAAELDLSPGEAVQENHRRILESRREAGDSIHPFYWAGFVASGAAGSRP